MRKMPDYCCGRLCSQTLLMLDIQPQSRTHIADSDITKTRNIFIVFHTARNGGITTTQ